jgi:hypothetical protein
MKVKLDDLKTTLTRMKSALQEPDTHAADIETVREALVDGLRARGSFKKFEKALAALDRFEVRGEMNDDAKLLAIKLVEAERDALRDSLRDMTEYAEEYLDGEDQKWGTFRKDRLDVVRSDIAKARALL